MPIEFHNNGSTFTISNPTDYSNWVDSFSKTLFNNQAIISVVFCSDKSLLEINQEYLQHDTYTDIITFDLKNPHDTSYLIEGELYISVDRIKENAKQFNVSFDVELRRVISHGIIHLNGYQDKAPAEKEIMRKKENEALALWGND